MERRVRRRDVRSDGVPADREAASSLYRRRRKRSPGARRRDRPVGRRQLRDLRARIPLSRADHPHAPDAQVLRGDVLVADVIVAEAEPTIVGFVTIERKSPAVREISWLAVDPDEHGDGVGSALVTQAEALVKRDGASVLEVKTLGASSDATNYD